MIIYKGSGICIFYHPFKEDEISSDLISGFISAMSSMYGEFTGDGTHESIESLKYQGMTLNGFNGNHVVGILISEGNIVTSFNLNDVINSFESEYEDVLKNWNGRLEFFDHDWIVKQLFDSLGYYNNLPFVVSSRKPEKKQYRKVVDFVSILSDARGRFLIRKVLRGLQKFLNKSEANTLDVLMMMKNEGIISPAPIKDILESNVERGVLIETLSPSVIVEDTIDDASDNTDELIGKEKTKDTERIEPQETGVPERNVTLTEDGRYSFETQISLDVLIRNAVDLWLRDVISDAVKLELGKQVVAREPEYTPIGYDSESGTIRIRVTFSIENQ